MRELKIIRMFLRVYVLNCEHTLVNVKMDLSHFG